MRFLRRRDMRAAIRYARQCWPMAMQKNGYTLEQIKELRFHAVEDFFAGRRSTLNAVMGWLRTPLRTYERFLRKLRREHCEHHGHNFEPFPLPGFRHCTHCGRLAFPDESV